MESSGKRGTAPTIRPVLLKSTIKKYYYSTIQHVWEKGVPGIVGVVTQLVSVPSRSAHQTRSLGIPFIFP